MQQPSATPAVRATRTLEEYLNTPLSPQVIKQIQQSDPELSRRPVKLLSKEVAGKRSWPPKKYHVVMRLPHLQGPNAMRYYFAQKFGKLFFTKGPVNA